jgi:GntR family transcriptional regulator
MDASHWQIDPASATPLFRQIAGQVARLVAAGQLQVGERLPSVRVLAARYGINAMTVSRAYASLVEEGVLERRRGAGMVVARRTERAGLTAEARMRLLEARMQELIREAKDLGLAAGPVCERLHALFLTPSAPPPRRALRPPGRAAR